MPPRRSGPALVLAFFKPYGVLSQFSPEPGSAKPTLASFGFPSDVYPLGRLDHDSEGLLLLSNDGRLNRELLDPTRRHPRSYLVQVEKIPDEAALERLRAGVVIEGRMTLPCRADLLAEPPVLPERPVPIRERRNIPTAWLRLTLVEGRNRQVRRMTAAVGYPTLRLVRESIGALKLMELGLEPGEWKKLDRSEVERVFV
jgi:23S rRNA pseudouridine2457 synthase